MVTPLESGPPDPPTKTPDVPAAVAIPRDDAIKAAARLRNQLDEHVEVMAPQLAKVLNKLTKDAISNAMNPVAVVAAGTVDGFPVDPRALDGIRDGWRNWLTTEQGQGVLVQVAYDPYVRSAETAYVTYNGVMRSNAYDMTAILPRVSQEGQQAALAAARNRLAGAADQTWRKARNLIDDGLRTNQTRETIMQSINAANLPGFNEHRADTVARTEIMKAGNEGLVDSQRALGDAGMSCKEWVATGDDRTRDWHLEADGQIVMLNEPFMVGGELLDQPGDGDADNSVNCRCTVVFVDCPTELVAARADEEAARAAEEAAAEAAEQAKMVPLTEGMTRHSDGVSTLFNTGNATDDTTEWARDAVREYEEQIPAPVQRMLIDHDVEVRITDGRLSDLDEIYATRSTHDGRTWNNVGGSYSPHDRKINIAERGHVDTPLSYRRNTVRHETGHAVDWTAADGIVSEQPAWRNIYRQVTEFPVDSYFDATARGRQEGFAELFAGYTHSRGPRHGLDVALERIGVPSGARPGLVAEFNGYFTRLLSDVAKRYPAG